MKDTIFSWVFKRLFKNYGRLRFCILETDLIFFESNGAGGFEKCEADNASAIRFSVKIKIYNKKDIPIRLDNMCFLFKRKDERYCEFPIYFPKEIRIPSWESISTELSSGLYEINSAQLENIVKHERIYLLGNLPNNKKIKKLLSKKKY